MGDLMRFVPFVVEQNGIHLVRSAGSMSAAERESQVAITPAGRSGLVELPEAVWIGERETVAIVGYTFAVVLREAASNDEGLPRLRISSLRDGFAVAIGSPLVVRETRAAVGRFCRERISLAIKDVGGDTWPTSIDLHHRVFVADASTDLSTRLLFQAAKDRLIGDPAAQQRLRFDAALQNVDPESIAERLTNWLDSLGSQPGMNTGIVYSSGGVQERVLELDRINADFHELVGAGR